MGGHEQTVQNTVQNPGVESMFEFLQGVLHKVLMLASEKVNVLLTDTTCTTCTTWHCALYYCSMIHRRNVVDDDDANTTT